MGTSDNLKKFVEQINDETHGPDVDVIVQMRTDYSQFRSLRNAASTALARRRMSRNARELLPSAYNKTIARASKETSASTRAFLGRTKSRDSFDTLSVKRSQRSSMMRPMLQNRIVRNAVERMGGPKRFWTSNSMHLKLKKDELVKLPEQLQNIRSIRKNRVLSIPSLNQSKPLGIETEDRLSTTWGLLKSNALAAWGAYGAEGQGIRVGLLDTGIDADHPDLAGKVSSFAEFDASGNLVGDTPRDSDEHGTHCGGTIVGGDESGRWIGMAPQAELAAALVLDGERGGTDAQVLAGIDWAVSQNVDVISMSLGGLVVDNATPPTYTEAIITCLLAGIPVVAAIGNEGEQTTGSPGNDLFALSVGATDAGDRAAGFSGGRTQIIFDNDFINPSALPLPYSKPDISAPGVAVFSSVPGGAWKAFSGTSMATPHVAGAIALLLSATRIKELESGEQKAFLIQDLINGSVDEIGESGQDHRYGFGRLDALRAIDYAYERGYGFV